MKICLCAWLAVCGAVAGSLIDCAVWRWVNGKPVFGYSYCASCGAMLGVLDLVPVASYLRSRGRCRHCGKKIPAECFWAEVGGAAVFALAAAGLEPVLSLELPKWLAFAGMLLAMSLIDACKKLVPDNLLIAMMANWLLWTVLEGSLIPALRSALASLAVPFALLAATLILEKILKRDVLGGGDIKLLVVFALYLSWAEMLLALLTACLLGLLWAALRSREKAIPFGPFLTAGCMLTVALGAPLVSRYMGVF